MGERANIYIVQHPIRGSQPTGIFIYSHWGGEGAELAVALQEALKLDMDSWELEGHLTRVIINTVSDVDPEINVTTYLFDNEYPILVVDAEKQTVAVTPMEYVPNARGRVLVPRLEGPLVSETPFAKFVTLSEDELEAFRDTGWPPDRDTLPVS